jgi:hypothetical protein
VRQWTFNEIPGATCYLLSNGNLLRAGKDNLEIRDWNNNVIWSYQATSNGINQHHDITPLPNGNILCIVTDTYTLSQMIAAGRNPAATDPSMKFEKIIEIQPVGTNAVNIVWEWKFMDHIIQDFDATKLNYGVVENHPELLDMNFNNGYTNDYIHANGIDYNSDLDQILISARHLNEIYIIDHSTTTSQAASNSGGNHNKGGDFLWRWGNPQVYRKGTESDRKLFLQHNPMWIENGYLDQGKITVFSNGEPNTAQTVSSVHIIQPEISSGNYTMTNDVFNPSNFEWTWTGTILGVQLDQQRQSGVQSQPNGNIIISEAILGRVSEITKDGILLWCYKNPSGTITNGLPTYYPQYITTSISNSFFKAEKYPSNFEGFIDKDLTPIGILEDTNLLSYQCNGTLNTIDFNVLNDVTLLNPVTNSLLQFNKTLIDVDLIIEDINGRLIYDVESFSGNELEITLKPSVYFITIENENVSKTIKVIVQ